MANTVKIQTHLETSDETDWPPQPSHQSVSSTPYHGDLEWQHRLIVATAKRSSIPTQATGIQLENSFAPLFQDTDFLKESLSSGRD